MKRSTLAAALVAASLLFAATAFADVMTYDGVGVESLNTAADYVGEKVAWLYETYASDVSTGAEAAGLAVAIWEVIYEAPGNSPDVTAGDFSISDNDDVVADATARLSGMPDRYEPGTDLVVLQSPRKQDMLILGPNVPEPAAICLLALGGLIQVARYRRRRRRR